MRKFFRRALEKFDKLSQEQVHTLLNESYRSQKLLESVLGSLGNGILVTDEENKIIYGNRAFERALPLGATEYIGLYPWKVIRDSHIARFLKKSILDQDSVDGKDFTMENGGELVTYMVSLSPLVEKGRVMGTIILFQNVTQVRSRDSRLRRAETLASLTTLTAGVAHEIKNPLGSIGIHLQLIHRALEKTQDPARKEVQSFVDVISEEVDRLNGIVVDFLFAVRPMDTKLENHRLSRVLEELVDFLKYELEENGISIDFIPAEKCDEFPLDDRFIKQAFLNVIKNSMAALPGGGKITLEVIPAQDHVVVKVQDNGEGIPSEYLDKIFEPYFTTKDSGSGLGLTLVFKIVKEHGGEVQVQSREGQGTTFLFTFPKPQEETPLLDYGGLD